MRALKMLLGALGALMGYTGFGFGLEGRNLLALIAVHFDRVCLLFFSLYYIAFQAFFSGGDYKGVARYDKGYTVTLLVLMAISVL